MSLPFCFAVIFKGINLGWDRLWISGESKRWPLHSSHERFQPRQREQGTTILSVVWSNCWFPYLLYHVEPPADYVSSHLVHSFTTLFPFYSLSYGPDLNIISYAHYSDSPLMALPLESSRTQRPLGSPSQRISPWGYTQVCGMLMTGQQEVDLWRQIGHKLHSQLPTETSMLKLAYGLLEHRLVVRVLLNPPVAHRGFRRSWTPQANRGWNGCRGTTWYTTIAQMRSVFHWVFLPNATSLERNTKRCSTFTLCSSRIRVPFRYLCIYVAIIPKFFHLFVPLLVITVLTAIFVIENTFFSIILFFLHLLALVVATKISIASSRS